MRKLKARNREAKPAQRTLEAAAKAERLTMNPLLKKPRRGSGLGKGLSVILGRNPTICIAAVHFGIHYTYDIAKAMEMNPPTVLRTLKLLVEREVLSVKEDRRTPDSGRKILRYELTANWGQMVVGIMRESDSFFQECMEWLEQRYPNRKI